MKENITEEELVAEGNGKFLLTVKLLAYLSGFIALVLLWYGRHWFPDTPVETASSLMYIASWVSGESLRFVFTLVYGLALAGFFWKAALKGASLARGYDMEAGFWDCLSKGAFLRNRSFDWDIGIACMTNCVFRAGCVTLSIYAAALLWLSVTNTSVGVIRFQEHLRIPLTHMTVLSMLVSMCLWASACSIIEEVIGQARKNLKASC